LQRRFGRCRALRKDAGAASPLLEKAAAQVASKKLEAFGLTGRWISTETAQRLAAQEGILPSEGLPAASSVNALIAARKLLEVRRSHEVIHAPAAHALHVADCSGSACFRTVEFADDSVIEATPAQDSTAEKNHGNKGRRRCYLFAVVDSHSGCLWTEYQSCVGPTSHAMAEFLLRTWRRSCVPVHLLTDNGAETRGAVDNLVRALGIKRLASRPRRPQARGVIERCFRSIFQAFEAPLLLELGVGSRLLVSDLNGRLQQWLGATYNAAPSRLDTTGRVSRYDRSQQGFHQRQVPESLIVPQVVMRQIQPIGKGCIRFGRSLYGSMKVLPFGAVLPVLVSGEQALAVLTEDGEQIPLALYVSRTGFEFADDDKPPSQWREALVALGVDERHLVEELGADAVVAIKADAEGMTLADLVAAIRQEGL